MLGDKAGGRISRALTGREPAGSAGRELFAVGNADGPGHESIPGSGPMPGGAPAPEARGHTAGAPEYTRPDYTPPDYTPPDYTPIEPGIDRRHWHPRCAAFAAYIEGLATLGRLPTRGMFEPTAIYRVLPNVWIVDVRRDPLRFAVRLAGTKVVEALGRDLTGVPFTQAFPGIDPGRDLERFVATVAARRGTWRRGRPFFDLGQAWAEIEDVVMPFAADGSTVDMLYCCAVFYGYDRMEW